MQWDVQHVELCYLHCSVMALSMSAFLIAYSLSLALLCRIARLPRLYQHRACRELWAVPPLWLDEHIDLLTRNHVGDPATPLVIDVTLQSSGLSVSWEEVIAIGPSLFLHWRNHSRWRRFDSVAYASLLILGRRLLNLRSLAASTNSVYDSLDRLAAFRPSSEEPMTSTATMDDSR